MESRVATSAASPLAVLRPGSLTGYWRFQRAVAKAQLRAWLPSGRRLLIDISGPAAGVPEQAAASGHKVVRVVPVHPGARGAGQHPPPLSRVAPVVAEPGSLAFLAGGCADGVIAEDGTLSRQLMAEDLAAEITRVLRPGGTVLASVDSLVLGMAILAEQHHWAHLTDLPHAEVVLIPWPDGTITRCFGAAQLYDLLTEAGLEVTSIRPRTVLSPSTVDHVLRKQPGAMPRLVRAELEAGQNPADVSADEAFGIRLVATARKPC
ncbi:MAG: methyltransferase [Actinobacteria bacterium]|nr:methyltransferase [Actinomycetota bacterium]